MKNKKLTNLKYCKTKEDLRNFFKHNDQSHLFDSEDAFVEFVQKSRKRLMEDIEKLNKKKTPS